MNRIEKNRMLLPARWPNYDSSMYSTRNWKKLYTSKDSTFFVDNSWPENYWNGAWCYAIAGKKWVVNVEQVLSSKDSILKMKDFWTILNSIKQSCDKANVQIITGDTKVVEKGKGDKIFINTSGIGVLHPNADIRLSKIKTGDAIIVSSNIADHGIAIMSKRQGLEFETDIKSDTTNLNFTIQKLVDAFGEKIHFLRDATRGGIASVLNEIAKDGNMGIDIQEKNIPLNEQVNGACEMLGLDPLYVANEGVFIAIIDATIQNEVMQLLTEDDNCKNAKVIGSITNEHIRQVILQSKIGGRRVVNMLPGEQLPRIC